MTRLVAAAAAGIPPSGRPARRRLVAAMLVAAAATAACGGGGDADRVSEGATSTSSTTTTAVPDEATTAPEDATSTTAGARSGPSTTTRATATTTTTAVRSAPAPGLTFSPPGTYRYTSTGQFTTSLGGTQPRNGESVLVVDPPSGTDQRSVRTGFGRTTEQVLRLSGDDALLVSMRLTDQGLDKEVRPNPPGLALAGDAAPGRTWSWRAVSTDGRTTVDSAFKVLRAEDVTVGGERVPAIVVEVTLTLAGDVTSTSKQTLWVSTARRLVLRQDDVTTGTLALITFSGTSSDVLVSLTPG